MTAAGAGAELPIALVGTDHRCAPLELRERVAYSGEAAEELLVHLLARPEVAEAALVSTCNRTEVYVHPRPGEDPLPAVVDLVFRQRAPELGEPGRLYVHRGTDAGRHLLAVACGLESMVLGEPEILGQIKQASALAEAVGASGTLLARLLRGAIKAGSRARRETAIGEGAVSLGYATVELARVIFTRLDATRVLLVGAGETARLAARSLYERGTRELAVTNRSPERLARFGAEFPKAEMLPWSEREAALAEVDLVVATTGAPEAVLSAGAVAAAMQRRPRRPLLLVDLGVPRDVEAAAGRLDNVFLHDLDSLDVLIQRNLKRRREEVPRVEEIVEEELRRLAAWYRGLEAEPLVARLQKQAEQIRRRELEAARARFPAEYHDELDRLTRSLVRKVLHHPSTRLRGRAGDDDARALPRLDLVRELFHLDDGPEEDEGHGEGGERDR